MNSKQIYMIVGLVLMFAVTGTALANDRIISTVTNGNPQAVIENNGAVSGTIRLTYTVVGTQFPCGQFGHFNLGLAYSAGSGQTGVPADLNLAESGNGTPVDLVPESPYFPVLNSDFAASTVVAVSINCSKLDEAPYDGQVIDGQLNMKATVLSSNKSAHIDTISTVQVHIKLVFPTTCLKLYSFTTYQDSGDLLTDIIVKPKNNDPTKVGSTNPGQLSVDALVANVCQSTENFDLRIDLGPWHTNPQGNPGEAIFTYTTDGEVDPDSYDFTAFGNKTGKGQNPCLGSLSLTGGDSLLARVHSSLKDVLMSALPTNGEFHFSATLFAAGSGCQGTPLGSSIVGPTNPAIYTLPFIIN